MQVKRRSGLMGEISSSSKAIKNAVTQPGRYHNTNQAAPIKNAVAMKPYVCGLEPVKNSVTKPNSH